MKKIDSDSWSSMWRNPWVTTFSKSDFAENYDGAILEFWQTQLDGRFNHIVDLACGNGALTWIANDLLNTGIAKTSITGIDFADIRPFATLGRKEKDYPEISFIGNTRMEELPFEDGSIDMVISQYGVEYSDLDQSIPEIARVLSPKGKMSFIVHDREGDLVKGATLPLKDYKTMLDVIRLDEFTLELAKIHEKSGGIGAQLQTDEYGDLINRIESLRGAVHSIAAKWPLDTVLANYRDRLEYALGEAMKKRGRKTKNLAQYIEESRDVLRMGIERKEDLVAASLTKKELKQLIARIKKAGFTITEKRRLIHAENLNWGTIVVAERAPAGGIFGSLKRRFRQLTGH